MSKPTPELADKEVIHHARVALAQAKRAVARTNKAVATVQSALPANNARESQTATGSQRRNSTNKR